MPYPWPAGFSLVPDEDWTRLPLEQLALKYDTVETHGWYSNLEPTVQQLEAELGPGDVLIDYSAGTGILARRLLESVGDRPIGIVLVDASPKFLRLALERLRGEERVAYRHLQWRKDERRLDGLDEVVSAAELGGPAAALASTNAVHLYSGLPETLGSWRRLLREGAMVHVQSGNIRNASCAASTWIIDETVEAIHEAAVRIVRGEGPWSAWREVVDDAQLMESHRALRQKFFLPVRPLEHYTRRMEEAGLGVTDVTAKTIEASVDDWYEFLSAYHEGVLGWAGGSRRVEGREPDEAAIASRLELMRAAMTEVFEGRDSFDCCWTYVTARMRGPSLQA